MTELECIWPVILTGECPNIISSPALTCQFIYLKHCDVTESRCGQNILSHCVVPENIHTPPSEGIFHMTPPPPLWIFQKRPTNYTPPPPSGNSNFFLYPLEIFLFLV